MKFECQQCGKCCGEGEVHFLPEDMEKLLAFLGIDYEELCRQHEIISIEDKAFILRTSEHCPFLENNLCSIEKIKPLYCRTYIPIMDDDGTPMRDACPGVGNGKDYTQEELDERNKLLCDRFNILLKEG